jgi:hypothetical protein
VLGPNDGLAFLCRPPYISAGQRLCIVGDRVGGSATMPTVVLGVWQASASRPHPCSSLGPSLFLLQLAGGDGASQRCHAFRKRGGIRPENRRFEDRTT